MPPDSLPQLSLGTAALAIFAVCAGFVMLRGIARMIVGTLVLGLSAWVGFVVWQGAPAWSLGWFGEAIPWVTNGLPVLVFLVTVFLLRKITHFVRRPFGGSSAPQKPRSMAGAAVRLVFALFPTSLISLIGIALVHHRGSVTEVRAASEKPGTASISATDDFIGKLKTAIDKGVPADWLAALDPLANPARLALAKMITARATPEYRPERDPKTGKPIPRAIIVNDPELQTLAREGKFDTLLRHPQLTKALSDPRVQRLLHDRRH